MSIAILQLTKNLNHSVNGMLTERRMNYRDMPVTIQVIECHHSGDWMAEFHPVYFFWPSFWRSPTGWPCTGSSSLWDQTQRTSHICSGPPDSSGKPSSQWCPQASPPVRAERKPLKTSASIPHIYMMHLF